MHLLFAADTYLHHPRNIFGFKKRKAKPEVRLVTTLLATSDGDVLHAAQYKAKLEDDRSSWEGRSVNSDYFGPPRRTGNNLDDMALEIHGVQCEGVLCLGIDSINALENSCERIYGSGAEAIGIENASNIKDFLADQLYRLDHRDLAMLSGLDYFASTIPLPSRGRYTIDQVRELLWSYCDIKFGVPSPLDATGHLDHMIHNYNQVVNVIPSIIKRLKS